METVTRKLIDLEPSVIRIINCKARHCNMTFKRYVEELVRKDARDTPEEERWYSDIRSKDILSLVGIARDVRESEDDDKLNYILSKMR